MYTPSALPSGIGESGSRGFSVYEHVAPSIWAGAVTICLTFSLSGLFDVCANADAEDADKTTNAAIAYSIIFALAALIIFRIPGFVISFFAPLLVR